MDFLKSLRSNTKASTAIWSALIYFGLIKNVLNFRVKNLVLDFLFWIVIYYIVLVVETLVNNKKEKINNDL